MNIYQHDSYKEILKQAVLEKKSGVSSRFSFQNLAKACRVQKTYLSKVLSHDGHLNQDQLFLACDYLGFTAHERHYLFLVFEFERSCVPKRRDELLAEIKILRKNVRKTESRLNVTNLETLTDLTTEYYLDPNIQIVHMFLTIPKYAANVSLIWKEMRISETTLHGILVKLQSLGIIELREGKYRIVKDNIHLPAESAVYRPYRSMMRIKALQRSEQLASEKTYNFSVVFSSSRLGRQKVHESFLEFLKKAQAEVTSGEATDVYQMNFDLFSWSESEPDRDM